ncbi:hypothetical protein BEL04_12525 [Mucilaginibacter sp. PPCGB 2223]|uniref:hypothetical protein n=1 Tax=Mucilaginibacter sp. PPCGB 2223 TaxID=1886027 RepID=UPI0008242C51|nr:hypothetical protein [Mucilaginibacter sp. PPCGB 2223]OCX52295.1 hypothetical protein BEL04_12525 [Mucilaginibacter sp. PPCGB 2223]
MQNTPREKKQWAIPELFIIASTEIENKSQAKYNEKTFISSQLFHTPSGTFNQLFFKNAPGGGVVGFNTKNAYHS